jgi:ATPase subunit of ABC transporter with duplicated ATPase domains
LLLDEPTNHIDLLSLEKIEQWILEFAGPVIVVTHDQYFINKLKDLNTKTIAITDFIH